jgi:hypothetical protein
MNVRAVGRTLFCLALVVPAVAGCGVPPGWPPPGAGPSNGPSSSDEPPPPVGPPATALPPLPTATAPPLLSGTGAPGVDPPPTPAQCRHGPTAAQLVALVRRSPGLPADVALRVTKGPYCAADWQYAEIGQVATPAPDPLVLISRGRPGSLRVVALGTDVCDPTVDAEAPPAIHALACE